MLACKTSIFMSVASAAARTSLSIGAAAENFGFSSTAIVDEGGTSSRNKPNRFGSNRLVSKVIPVAFPPGRLKLATNPSFTGSPPIVNIIGIVEVAAAAANTAGSPPVVVRSDTGRPTSSAAIAGSRSY